MHFSLSSLATLREKLKFRFEGVALTYKMRLLLLHGYGQDATVLPQKLRRALEKRQKRGDLEIVSPQGLYPVNIPSRSGFSWFTYHNFDTFDREVTYAEGHEEEWIGVQASLDYLQTLGSFDAILGFSQGAHLAHYLAPLMKGADGVMGVKKVIFIAGFVNPTPSNLNIVANPATQTLHVIGQQDELITPEMSKRLVEFYQDAEVVYHNGKHVIPSSGVFRQKLVTFLGLK